MKIWRFCTVLWFIGIFFVQAPSASALVITVRTDWVASPFHRATPGYVWQNDPDILKTYNTTSVTNLCLTSAIGTALLHQFAYETPSSGQLKLAGYSAVDGQSPTIDTAKLLADLTTRCKGDVALGTTIDNSVRCSAEFYQNSGYSNAKVKVIRRYDHSMTGRGVEHENRLATPMDIEAALAQGYQVIASLAIIHWDENLKKWQKVSSHSMNVVGLSPDKNFGAFRLFVVNPTRAYQIDGVNPVFDEARIATQTEVVTPFPERYSPWVISGPLLTRPNTLTVLAGLLLLRTH